MSNDPRYYTPPIPNGWFQVAYDDEVKPGDVIPLKYFGKDLVLFRTEGGELTVLDAFCPHLGAHLGHGGCVKGESIQCPFHAWRFGADGKCVEVPYAQRQPKKADIPRWHVQVTAGLVMVWHHAEGKAPEWTLPEVPEFGSPEWTDYTKRRWQIRTRNQEMAENQVDSAHFHYVHGATNMPQSEASVDGHIMRVRSTTGMTTPMGPVQGVVASESHGFGFSMIRFGGIVDTLLISSVTPIDEDNVDVRFSFMVKKIGGSGVTAGVGKAFVAEIERQLEQDIPIWENKIQHARPLLCDGDGPIGLFRRWCTQFYSWPQDTPQAAE
ncbi:MAG: Rieske 2Fe-2S domain-containing protein [Myxococcales bacterium]|jgi:3-ketosteroid 9alpha-monooxygenase subunit A|nr:Rieske 2Fe-2S domain-containing protein [Myxococcales bacterium]